MRCVSVKRSMCSLCCFMNCVGCKGLVADLMFCTFHCPIRKVSACGSLVWCALPSWLGLDCGSESVRCRMRVAICALLLGRVGRVNGALELGTGTGCLRRCLVACLRVAVRGFKARGSDVLRSSWRGLPPEGGRCPGQCRRASPALSCRHSFRALLLHFRYSRLAEARRMSRGFVERGRDARVIRYPFLFLRLSPKR